MANDATNIRADLLEVEYDAGLTLLIRASILLVISAIMLWFFGGIYPVPVLQVLAGFGLAGSFLVAVWGGWRMYKARTRSIVTVNCPYCDFPMEFFQEPTQDFDCHGCHRRVQYENGAMVPIKMITCAFCKTVHKVSAKTTHFTCDRCNRSLRLTDPRDPTRVIPEETDAHENFDVILTEVGRQKNEVAMALESILVCNLLEARRQMENLPLTVMRNVPQRKADAVRRRLRELGATAVIQPTNLAEQARAGRR